MLWCEVSLVSQHVGTGGYHLAWGPEVGRYLVSSPGGGSAASVVVCTCIAQTWLIFFEAVTAGDNLLKGNCDSICNDHGLTSHSDLEGSHLVYKVLTTVITFLAFFFHIITTTGFYFCHSAFTCVLEEYQMSLVHDFMFYGLKEEQ